MPELRPRPDLRQLRRQARELLNAAAADDPLATARLAAVSARPTLSAAQLAVARDHGFPSWPKLKAEAERRRARPRFVLRYAASHDELQALNGKIWEIFGAPRRPLEPWMSADLQRPGGRRRILVVLQDDRLIGGAIGLRLIALESHARGAGLGARLLQTAEAETLAAGEDLGTHVSTESQGFFLKMGYHEFGKGLLMRKGAPLSPRMVEIRLRRWQERAGDLVAGVVLEPDPGTGTIPRLPW